ncbi:MAG: glycerophosphodiester phosphodiesterase [Planctomycetales bacterium]|nr:glycerophosphodiester phosphodiesterase [Planctomycetales bacterium]
MTSWLVAHRGASHDAPESTLSAFRLAWDQGADGIEADFFLTGDQRIVCIHDRNTLALSGVDLEVAHATLAELKQLDVGIRQGEAWRGERIPAIEEVLAVIPPDKKFFIELKSGPEIVAPLASVLQASTLASDQVYVISFNEETLIECKRLLPNVRTHWLSFFFPDVPTGGWTPTALDVAAALRRTQANGFGGQCHPDGFNASFVGALRAAGYSEFHVWWVNDVQAARFYQDLGALSLTTSCPAKLRAELNTTPEAG